MLMSYAKRSVLVSYYIVKTWTESGPVRGALIELKLRTICGWKVMISSAACMMDPTMVPLLTNEIINHQFLVLWNWPINDKKTWLAGQVGCQNQERTDTTSEFLIFCQNLIFEKWPAHIDRTVQYELDSSEPIVRPTMFEIKKNLLNWTF